MTLRLPLVLLLAGMGQRKDAAFGFITTRSTTFSARSVIKVPKTSSVLYSASPVVLDDSKKPFPSNAPANLTTATSSAVLSPPLPPVSTTTTKKLLSEPASLSPIGVLSTAIFGNENSSNREYQRGLITIGFITLLFSSNSPVLHAAFQTTATGVAGPPCLLLNAAVSAVALVGLLLGGDTLEQNTDLPSTLQSQKQSQPPPAKGDANAQVVSNKSAILGGGVQEPQEPFLEAPPQSTLLSLLTSMTQEDKLVLQGGLELGLWKFLGTTANIYGLSLPTAAHGAFLIQLTTLIVPVVQGIMGVPIPQRIQWSIVLALAGVVCFTQDPTGTPSMMGDGLCVLAAMFYATYDLRLFSWGKKVVPRRLITGKIATQAMLSLGLLLTAGSTSGLFGTTSSGSATSDLSAWQETLHYLSTNPQWSVLIPVVLWSGIVVNALAPFLQVGGQQAVGPTRCQTIYASQPLWAAIMGFVVFGETIGWQGLVGGSAFLTALFLAATTEAPDPDCGKQQCEV